MLMKTRRGSESPQACLQAAHESATLGLSTNHFEAVPLKISWDLGQTSLVCWSSRLCPALALDHSHTHRDPSQLYSVHTVDDILNPRYATFDSSETHLTSGLGIIPRRLMIGEIKLPRQKGRLAEGAADWVPGTKRTSPRAY